MCNEQIQAEKYILFEVQKQHIQEIGRLSKRIVVSESERVNLLNQLDLLKDSNAEILSKYNRMSADYERRVSIAEHTKQINELK